MAGVEFGPEIGDSVYTAKASALFKRADKNGDGVIDGGEIDVLNSIFGEGFFSKGKSLTYAEFIGKVPKAVEDNPDLADKLAQVKDEKIIKNASIK